MATTVAQHSVATFTSPVNGTTPIDANTVRGNDNTTRAAYNDHDADPGIHVQSSSLASRPVAGTAGRKWITDDSGVYTLWFDDGTNWHPVSSENVALTVLAGENLVKGDVVKVTGWNNGQDLPEVVKTTSAADTAFAVITAAVSSGSMGYATNTGIVQDVNTAAYSVGTILYANGSGGFTSTKPTSGNYQPVAFVLRANASNGVYYVEFSTPRIVERSDNTASTVVLRDASGNFSAGTITATTLNATTVNATTFDMTNLEVTNIKAKDGTSAATIADSTGVVTFTSTVSGSITGNAGTATALQTARNINGVSFNGTADITVTAAAGTLTGTTLASGVTASSLTSVGTLSSLTVSGNTILGAEVFRSADNSFMRVAGGNPSATGAALVLFGSTHATAPGRIDLNAVGTGTFNISTGGAARASIDASGNLAVDTNTLYVDAANNRVGVGTASPVFTMDVTSGTTGNIRALGTTGNAYFRATNTGGTAYFGIDSSTGGLGGAYSLNVWHSGAYPIVFGTNDVARAQIDASGNLGLGVTPSAWVSGDTILQIKAGTSSGALWGRNASVRLIANAYFDGTNFKYIASDYGTMYLGNANGQHLWYNAPSGTAGNNATFTQVMTLDASGNLGVGISSSIGARVHAYSTTAMAQLTVDGVGAIKTGINFANGGTAFGQIYFDNNSPYDMSVFQQYSTGSLRFGTNNTERARITSVGDLLVGKTTLTDTVVGFAVAGNPASSQCGAITSTLASSTSGNTTMHVYSTGATAYRFYVDLAGTVFATTTTISAISDARLKENVRDLNVGLDAVLALKPRVFDWKAGKGKNIKNDRGFIAQEFEQVFPDLIDEWKDPAPDGEAPYKSVRQDLIPVLVKAIQELTARVVALETN